MGEALAGSPDPLRNATVRSGFDELDSEAASGSKLMPPAKRHATMLFRRMDYNGNGALSLAEIDKAVVELYPGIDHKPVLMRAYKATDKGQDGLIERREFRKLLHYLVYFNNLWHKFEEIDSDGDRRLTEAEFVKGCAVVGVTALEGTTSRELQSVFRQVRCFCVAES